MVIKLISIIENTKQLQSELLNWLKKINDTNLSKKRIFLKPNMGYPKKSPFTTSLEVIEAIIKVFSNFNVKEIIIGEGSTSKSTALDNFYATGLIERLENYEVKFLDLNTLESTEVNLESGATHYLPSILAEVDYRISVPVIKYYDDDNGKFFLSNAIKNFFGLPPKVKYQLQEESHMRDSLHSNLHKSVAEIYQAVQKFAPFHLYICDGLTTLFGFANEGKPKKWGKILIADNALKADSKILELMKKPYPEFLKILQEK